MSKRIQVLIADDVDYEDIFVEIQIDGDCVAVLSQENGEFEFETDHMWTWSTPRKKISLSEFKDALDEAEAALRRMKRTES